MLTILFVFIIGLLVQAGAYYLGAKFTGNKTPFKVLFLIALIGAVLGAIPAVGWLIGPLAVLVLLSKWGAMNIWPDAVLTVIIAWGLLVLFRLILTFLAAPAAA